MKKLFVCIGLLNESKMPRSSFSSSQNITFSLSPLAALSVLAFYTVTVHVDSSSCSDVTISSVRESILSSQSSSCGMLPQPKTYAASHPVPKGSMTKLTLFYLKASSSTEFVRSILIVVASDPSPPIMPRYLSLLSLPGSDMSSYIIFMHNFLSSASSTLKRNKVQSSVTRLLYSSSSISQSGLRFSGRTNQTMPLLWVITTGSQHLFALS